MGIQECVKTRNEGEKKRKWVKKMEYVENADTESVFHEWLKHKKKQKKINLGQMKIVLRNSDFPQELTKTQPPAQ